MNRFDINISVNETFEGIEAETEDAAIDIAQDRLMESGLLEFTVENEADVDDDSDEDDDSDDDQ